MIVLELTMAISIGAGAAKMPGRARATMKNEDSGTNILAILI